MTSSLDIFSSTNPAFCSLVLLSFCEGYAEEAGNEVPYVFLMFPLPLILSGDLLESFKNTSIKTGFYTWVKSNPQLLVNLNERIESSNDFTRPAIAFAFSKNVLKLNPNGTITPLKENVSKYSQNKNVEIYFKNAKRLGGWLGQIKSPKTIFNHLGLQA
jgi:hypothetical protein